MGQKYECNECGNVWESEAKRPQCTNSDCRTTDVSKVEAESSEETNPEEGGSDDETPTPQGSETGEDDDESSEETGLGSVNNYEQPDFEGVSGGFDEEDYDNFGPEDNDDEDDEDDEAEEIPEIEPEDIEPALDATFEVLAWKQGNHWQLEGPEAETLAQAYAPLINKYAPVLIKQHTLEASAVLVTIQVIGPKIKEEKRKRREEQEEQETTDDYVTEDDTATTNQEEFVESMEPGATDDQEEQGNENDEEQFSALNKV